MNTADFGLPQNRERVYFVAIKKGSRLKWKRDTLKEKEAASKYVPLKSILEDRVDEKYYLRSKYIERYVEYYNAKKSDKSRIIEVGGLGKARQGQKVISSEGVSGALTCSAAPIVKISQGNRVYSEEGIAMCQSANTGGLGRGSGLYRRHGRIRRLTLKEQKRLMGFSDKHYVSSGMQGLKQIGNSVSPRVIGAIYEQLT